ncbi:MAG: DNA-binding protein [Oscillospiraceae bacterium]|nr:DNA-binding protein [Oscillospiraceae bacterium]
METVKRKLLTVREAASLVDGLFEYRVRKICMCGQLDHFKSGNRVLITDENLMKAVFGSEKSIISDRMESH